MSFSGIFSSFMFSDVQEVLLLQSGLQEACVVMIIPIISSIGYFQCLVWLAQACCSVAMCCNIDRMWFGIVILK